MDRLERTVKLMTLSKCSAEEEFWSESYLMMEVKKHLRPSGHYDDRTVMKVVEKRIQALRHQRADIRAAEYKSHYPTSLADPAKERERIIDFANLVNWPHFTDVKRVMDASSRMSGVSRSRQSSRKKAFNPNLEWRLCNTPYFQDDLKDRCENQFWPGVCDVVYPTMGRGIIATKPFNKDDVIFDYHGHVEENTNNVDYYCSLDPENRKPEYCIEVKTRPGRIIDATSEICPIHNDGRRCLARLCNYSSTFDGGKTNPACNMKLVELKCTYLKNNPRYVLLFAKRKIEPLEQLMFDYMDPEANRIFGGNAE